MKQWIGRSEQDFENFFFWLSPFTFGVKCIAKQEAAHWRSTEIGTWTDALHAADDRYWPMAQSAGC